MELPNNSIKNKVSIELFAYTIKEYGNTSKRMEIYLWMN